MDRKIALWKREGLGWSIHEDLGHLGTWWGLYWFCFDIIKTDVHYFILGFVIIPFELGVVVSAGVGVLPLVIVVKQLVPLLGSISIDIAQFDDMADGNVFFYNQHFVLIEI